MVNKYWLLENGYIFSFIPGLNKLTLKQLCNKKQTLANQQRQEARQ